MKFGAVPVEQSVGAIAVHGVHLRGVAVRKGECVTAAHAAALTAAGAREIVVVRLEPGDVGENEAARVLAEALRGPGLGVDRAFTGRANLFATVSGVVTIDTAAIDRINAIDEAITLASLPPFRAVEPGEMVATIKIIPFAVPGEALARALACAPAPPIAVAAYRPLRIGVISTVLPGLKESVIAKTLRVLEARLAPAKAPIVAEARVPHDAGALAAAIHGQAERADIVIVFGASAIADRRDVVPAGLVAAGGTIEHFGMPVDPGNLLLMGRLGDMIVLGAPGCARSPKENGFDWVLQRVLAGLTVTPADIRRLGTGGLLMEIVSRPQPRSGSAVASDGEGRE